MHLVISDEGQAQEHRGYKSCHEGWKASSVERNISILTIPVTTMVTNIMATSRVVGLSIAVKPHDCGAFEVKIAGCGISAARPAI
jgi:hypothetical protein